MTSLNFKQSDGLPFKGILIAYTTTTTLTFQN